MFIQWQNMYQVSTMCLANVQGNGIIGMSKKHQIPTFREFIFKSRKSRCVNIYELWKKPRQSKADRERGGREKMLFSYSGQESPPRWGNIWAEIWEVSHMAVWREILSGGMNSKCACPEVTTFLSCFRNSKDKHGCGWAHKK